LLEPKDDEFEVGFMTLLYSVNEEGIKEKTSLRAKKKPGLLKPGLESRKDY